MVGGAGKASVAEMREISVGRMRVVKISQVFRVGALIASVGVADTIFGAKSDDSGAIVRPGSTPKEASICRWDIGAGHMSVRASRPLDQYPRWPANGRTRANAYVEPSAMAAFAKAGRWLDGSQIVSEIQRAEAG
jgi:hypothetical protein